MSSRREITAEALSEAGFSKFGTAVAVPDEASVRSEGPGWMCWYPLAKLSNSALVQLGLVETTPATRRIVSMERHVSRAECVFAIAEPIVQVVALGTSAEQPRVQDAQAFVIQPGQAVLIAAGTWHSVAIPLAEHATRYMFALPSSAEPSEDWTAFSDGAALIVVAAETTHHR